MSAWPKRTKRIVIGCTIALVLAAIAVFIFLKAFDSKGEEAYIRIDEALSEIRVGLPVGYGPTTQLLGELLSQPEGYNVPYITVDLDFERILHDVQYDDFNSIGDARSKLLLNDLYIRLGQLFDRTDDLRIKQSNSSAWDRFDLPDDMRERFDFTTENDFPINISRFLTMERNKHFQLETEFGILELYSEFFYGKSQDGDNDFIAGGQEDAVLHFGYTEEPDGNVTIHVLLEDADGKEILQTERPGKSLLLTLPLSLDFMRDSNGSVLYNAVQYSKDTGLFDYGILPRSFTDGDNMYVFMNRLGRFQPVRTPRGTTVSSNIADFLSDRDIELKSVRGAGGEALTTRASFFAALMHIHWFETFEFFTGDTLDFPDVSDPELNRILTVGKAHDILHGMPSGNPRLENPFFPDDPIKRGEMFSMLSRYIQIYELSAGALMPTDPRAEGLPDGDRWWYGDDFFYLVNIGFVPYRRIGQTNYVLGDDYALLSECQEVLYKLLTSTNF